MIYLDHNATSPLRPEAKAAMARALDIGGNPSSVHAAGRAARAIMCCGLYEQSRDWLARLGCTCNHAAQCQRVRFRAAADKNNFTR